MKILVTGAAGFIGHHISQRLVSDGHTVIGIDNLKSRRDTELKSIRLSLLGVPMENVRAGVCLSGINGFSFIQLDILDREAILSLCRREKFDAVLHLAAVTGNALAFEVPLLFADTNIIGTANLLEGARLNGVKHFFFSSSACVHGWHAHAPLKESDDVDSPLSMYAGTKRAAELLCYSYAQSYKMPVSIFRFFTVFGPLCRPDSLPMQLAHSIIEGKEISILNNGHILRDFTYIDDVVDGLVSVLPNAPIGTLGGAPYELYNIGSSRPVSYLAFIQTLEMCLGKTAKIKMIPDSPISMGEAVEVYADTSKLESQLAYSPAWDYAEALPLFAQWFRENYNRSFHM